MCGRFTRTTSPAALADAFATAPPGAEALAAPAGLLTPGQPILIVRFNPATRQRALDPVRWGLIPHWARARVPAGKLFNARAETLAERAAFREPVQRRRCLIPAETFFESQDGPPPRTQIRLRRPDGGLLALAGLWDNWRDAAGIWHRSATIITTAATAPVAAVHSRMPVLLPPDCWPLWLGETAAPANAIAALLASRPEPALEAVADGGQHAQLDLSQ